jgi:DNA-binding transcriptional LysR family regulator
MDSNAPFRERGVMNFSQIQSFIIAAECENFTRTAEKLYMSQPVLSRHISTMEDELGVKLFEREKRAVHLTSAGKIMYEGMVRLMREYNATTANALAAHNRDVNCLKIGFVEGNCFSQPFAGPVKAFCAANPDIQTNLMLYHIKRLKEALLEGEVDVALVAKFIDLDEDPNMEYIEVGRTPKMMAVPLGHRLAGNKVIGIEDMNGESLITLDTNESIVETDDMMEKLAGIEHRLILVPDVGAFAMSIEAGFGIALINDNHALRNNPNLRFIPTKGFSCFVETATWRKNNPNPAIALLIKQFKKR